MRQSNCPINISIMSGKLHGLKSINVNPLTNEYCDRMALSSPICRNCYSRRMLRTFRMYCIPPFEENSKILSSSILPDSMLPDFSKTRNKYFRFSAHGELINDIHFINLCNIARKTSTMTFTLWTKRVNIVNRNIQHVPKNMILIYSNSIINKMPLSVPKNFSKVFSVFTTEYAKLNKVKLNCVGKCLDCKKCYTTNKINFINEAVKQERLKQLGAIK